MKRNLKFYKKAVQWIKAASGPTDGTGLNIPEAMYNAIDQDLAEAYGSDYTSLPGAAKAYHIAYVYRNFKNSPEELALQNITDADSMVSVAGMPYAAIPEVARYAAGNNIAGRFGERWAEESAESRQKAILRVYQNAALKAHLRKMTLKDENGNDLDPDEITNGKYNQYQVEQARAQQDVVNGDFTNATFTAPDDVISRSDPSLYSIPGFGIYAQPTAFSSAMDTFMPPLIASQYIEQAESTPKVFTPLKKLTGLEFWPVEKPEVADAELKKIYKRTHRFENRGKALQELRYRNMSKLTPEQMAGGGLDLSMTTPGRVGKYAFRYGLPGLVVGTELYNGANRFSNAYNAENWNQKIENGFMGTLNFGTAGGFAADMAVETPAIYRLLSHSPKLLRGFRGAGRMGGALFAATAVTEPLADFTETYLEGQPILNQAMKDKADVSAATHGFRSMIMHDPDNPDQYSDLYKFLVKTDPGGKDETSLSQTGGRFGLYPSSFTQSYGYLNPKNVGWGGALANIVGLGSKESPTINPFSGWWRKFKDYKYHPEYKEPGAYSPESKVNDEYLDLLNTHGPEYPREQDHVTWYPTRFGFRPINDSSLYYSMKFRENSAHHPTSTTGGRYLSPYQTGADSTNKQLYLTYLRNKENANNEQSKPGSKTKH